MNTDARASREPAGHLGYRRWLDGLRGVAVLLVLAFHWSLIPGGWLGVDVFFVLSGFLITSLLAEEWQAHAAISLRRFYLRRALRLLPAFYLLLAAVGLHAVLTGRDPHEAGREILVAACYVANYPMLHGVNLPALGHTWSLSVEEQFYLIWPVLLVLLLKLCPSRRWVLTAVVLGIVACFVHRGVMYHLHSSPPSVRLAYIYRMYLGLDTRADALLVGCLVGLLATWGMLPRSQAWVRAFSWAAAASAVALGYFAATRCLDHSQFYRGLFTGVALMVAAILVRLLIAPAALARWTLECGWLVGTGRISYGLYLFHLPVIAWVFPRAALGYTWRTPLACAVTFAAALLSYWLVERPCLRLKDRFRSVGTSPAKPAEVSARAA